LTALSPGSFVCAIKNLTVTMSSSDGGSTVIGSPDDERIAVMTSRFVQDPALALCDTFDPDALPSPNLRKLFVGQVRLLCFDVVGAMCACVRARASEKGERINPLGAAEQPLFPRVQVPREFHESDLRPIFEEFGEVEDVIIIRDRRTGLHRGCAFVTFADEESAQSAMLNLHEKHRIGPSQHTLQVSASSRVRQDRSHRCVSSTTKGESGRREGGIA
jgi:hypothetical protein